MKLLSAAILLLTAGMMAGAAPEIPRKGVLVEFWDGFKNGLVQELLDVCDKRPPKLAHIKGRIDEHDIGQDYFGLRISAFLTPPETGEYTFYLAADDTAELLLSTDESPAHLQRICQVRSYMPRHHFVSGPASGKAKLQKGKRYYLLLHYKEAINDEHVSLAWEGPGVSKGIIAKKYFEPALNEQQRKLWQQTAEREQRGSTLCSTMLKQKPEQLASWLETLNHQDRQCLLEVLTQEQNRISRLSSKKFQKEMRPYLKAAEGIVATPQSPVRNPVAKTLLHMEAAWLKSLSDKQLLKLGAHRLAASLGSIPPKAKSVKFTQTLHSHGDKWGDEYVSMGLYARPGKAVTVTIPESLASSRLEIQVGHHFPHKNMPLVCMPDTTRWFRLTEKTTTFVTPHGGLMLLKVPRAVALNDAEITVQGALKAPRFILGKHSDEDWATLKNAPAPWGELVSEHLVLVVPRDILQKVTNPTEVMTWWNENNRDLEDFYSYYPKLPFRMHAGHYAVEGVSFWPLHWEPVNMAYLLNMDAMKKKNSALFLHEHGHHSDFGEMELSFWAESTTNWGGYYMKAREGKSFDWKDSHDLHLRRLYDPEDKGMQEVMQDKWYKISNKGTHHWSYPVTSMMIGYAEEFGWDCVKATIKRLRNKEDEMYKWSFVQNAEHDQAKIDRYLIGLSQAARRDVRPYFAHFKLFPSEGAASHLDGLKLPKWDLSYLVQPEQTTTGRNEPLAIPCGKAQILSFARRSRIKWNPTTAQGGTVTLRKPGEAVYTPAPDFTGEDIISYHLSNHQGKGVEKKLRITVK